MLQENATEGDATDVVNVAASPLDGLVSKETTHLASAAAETSLEKNNGDPDHHHDSHVDDDHVNGNHDQNQQEEQQQQHLAEDSIMEPTEESPQLLAESIDLPIEPVTEAQEEPPLDVNQESEKKQFEEEIPCSEIIQTPITMGCPKNPVEEEHNTIEIIAEEPRAEECVVEVPGAEEEEEEVEEVEEVEVEVEEEKEQEKEIVHEPEALSSSKEDNEIKQRKIQKVSETKKKVVKRKEPQFRLNPKKTQKILKKAQQILQDTNNKITKQKPARFLSEVLLEEGKLLEGQKSSSYSSKSEKGIGDLLDFDKESNEATAATLLGRRNQRTIKEKEVVFRSKNIRTTKKSKHIRDDDIYVESNDDNDNDVDVDDDIDEDLPVIGKKFKKEIVKSRSKSPSQLRTASEAFAQLPTHDSNGEEYTELQSILRPVGSASSKNRNQKAGVTFAEAISVVIGSNVNSNEEEGSDSDDSDSGMQYHPSKKKDDEFKRKRLRLKKLKAKQLKQKAIASQEKKDREKNIESSQQSVPKVHNFRKFKTIIRVFFESDDEADTIQSNSLAQAAVSLQSSSSTGSVIAADLKKSKVNKLAKKIETKSPGLVKKIKKGVKGKKGKGNGKVASPPLPMKLSKEKKKNLVISKTIKARRTSHSAVNAAKERGATTLTVQLQQQQQPLKQIGKKLKKSTKDDSTLVMKKELSTLVESSLMQQQKKINQCLQQHVKKISQIFKKNHKADFEENIEIEQIDNINNSSKSPLPAGVAGKGKQKKKFISRTPSSSSREASREKEKEKGVAALLQFSVKDSKDRLGKNKSITAAAAANELVIDTFNFSKKRGRPKKEISSSPLSPTSNNHQHQLALLNATSASMNIADRGDAQSNSSSVLLEGVGSPLKQQSMLNVDADYSVDSYGKLIVPSTVSVGFRRKTRKEDEIFEYSDEIIEEKEEEISSKENNKVVEYVINDDQERGKKKIISQEEQQKSIEIEEVVESLQSIEKSNKQLNSLIVEEKDISNANPTIIAVSVDAANIAPSIVVDVSTTAGILINPVITDTAVIITTEQNSVPEIIKKGRGRPKKEVKQLAVVPVEKQEEVDSEKQKEQDQSSKLQSQQQQQLVSVDKLSEKKTIAKSNESNEGNQEDEGEAEGNQEDEDSQSDDDIQIEEEQQQQKKSPQILLAQENIGKPKVTKKKKKKRGRKKKFSNYNNNIQKNTKKEEQTIEESTAMPVEQSIQTQEVISKSTELQLEMSQDVQQLISQVIAQNVLVQEGSLEKETRMTEETAVAVAAAVKIDGIEQISEKVEDSTKPLPNDKLPEDKQECQPLQEEQEVQVVKKRGRPRKDKPVVEVVPKQIEQMIQEEVEEEVKKQQTEEKEQLSPIFTDQRYQKNEKEEIQKEEEQQQPQSQTVSHSNSLPPVKGKRGRKPKNFGMEFLDEIIAAEVAGAVAVVPPKKPTLQGEEQLPTIKETSNANSIEVEIEQSPKNRATRKSMDLIFEEQEEVNEDTNAIQKKEQQKTSLAQQNYQNSNEGTEKIVLEGIKNESEDVNDGSEEGSQQESNDAEDDSEGEAEKTVVAAPQQPEVQVPKPRGRPRKNPLPYPIVQQIQQTSIPAIPKKRKKRGKWKRRFTKFIKKTPASTTIFTEVPNNQVGGTEILAATTAILQETATPSIIETPIVNLQSNKPTTSSTSSARARIEIEPIQLKRSQRIKNAQIEREEQQEQEQESEQKEIEKQQVDDVDAPPKKRRGRPPKIQQPQVIQKQDSDAISLKSEGALSVVKTAAAVNITTTAKSGLSDVQTKVREPIDQESDSLSLSLNGSDDEDSFSPIPSSRSLSPTVQPPKAKPEISQPLILQSSIVTTATVAAAASITPLAIVAVAPEQIPKRRGRPPREKSPVIFNPLSLLPQPIVPVAPAVPIVPTSAINNNNNNKQESPDPLILSSSSLSKQYSPISSGDEVVAAAAGATAALELPKEIEIFKQTAPEVIPRKRGRPAKNRTKKKKKGKGNWRTRLMEQQQQQALLAQQEQASSAAADNHQGTHSENENDEDDDDDDNEEEGENEIIEREDEEEEEEQTIAEKKKEKEQSNEEDGLIKKEKQLENKSPVKAQGVAPPITVQQEEESGRMEIEEKPTEPSSSVPIIEETVLQSQQQQQVELNQKQSEVHQSENDPTHQTNDSSIVPAEPVKKRKGRPPFKHLINQNIPTSEVTATSTTQRGQEKEEKPLEQNNGESGDNSNRDVEGKVDLESTNKDNSQPNENSANEKLEQDSFERLSLLTGILLPKRERHLAENFSFEAFSLDRNLRKRTPAQTFEKPVKKVAKPTPTTVSLNSENEPIKKKRGRPRKFNPLEQELAQKNNATAEREEEQEAGDEEEEEGEEQDELQQQQQVVEDEEQEDTYDSKLIEKLLPQGCLCDLRTIPSIEQYTLEKLPKVSEKLISSIREWKNSLSPANMIITTTDEVNNKQELIEKIDPPINHDDLMQSEEPIQPIQRISYEVIQVDLVPSTKNQINLMISDIISKLPFDMHKNEGILFVWATAKQLDEIVEVLPAYNYTLIETLIWVKTTENSMNISSHSSQINDSIEFCLIFGKSNLSSGISRQFPLVQDEAELMIGEKQEDDSLVNCILAPIDENPAQIKPLPLIAILESITPLATRTTFQFNSQPNESITEATTEVNQQEEPQGIDEQINSKNWIETKVLLEDKEQKESNKMEIEGEQMPKQLEKPKKQTHYHFKCDSCGMLPISGLRFSCETCPRFNLCQSCYFTVTNESISNETHLMSHKLTQKKSTQQSKSSDGVIVCNECNICINEIGYKCNTCRNSYFCESCCQPPEENTNSALFPHKFTVLNLKREDNNKYDDTPNQQNAFEVAARERLIRRLSHHEDDDDGSMEIEDNFASSDLKNGNNSHQLILKTANSFQSENPLSSFMKRSYIESSNTEKAEFPAENSSLPNIQSPDQLRERKGVFSCSSRDGLEQLSLRKSGESEIVISHGTTPVNVVTTATTAQQVQARSSQQRDDLPSLRNAEKSEGDHSEFNDEEDFEGDSQSEYNNNNNNDTEEHEKGDENQQSVKKKRIRRTKQQMILARALEAEEMQKINMEKIKFTITNHSTTPKRMRGRPRKTMAP